jgi:hypothetical protein
MRILMFSHGGEGDVGDAREVYLMEILVYYVVVDGVKWGKKDTEFLGEGHRGFTLASSPEKFIGP